MKTRGITLWHPFRALSSPLHLGLLRSDILPLCLAFLGRFLLRIGLLFGRLPIVVLVLPLILEVADREVAARFDPLLLSQLRFRQFDLGLRGGLVRVGRLAGGLEPVFLLVQPFHLGGGDLDSHVGDLLAVAGGVGAVLVVGSVGRLLLGARLVDLQRGLFLFVLRDAPLAVELVDLGLHGALLAVRHLQVVLSREDVLLFAGGDRVDRRVVDLILEPAAAAGDADQAEQGERRHKMTGGESRGMSRGTSRGTSNDGHSPPSSDGSARPVKAAAPRHASTTMALRNAAQYSRGFRNSIGPGRCAVSPPRSPSAGASLMRLHPSSSLLSVVTLSFGVAGSFGVAAGLGCAGVKQNATTTGSGGSGGSGGSNTGNGGSIGTGNGGTGPIPITPISGPFTCTDFS